MITISSTKTHQQCWTHYPAFKCLLNKTVLKNEYSEFLSLPDKTKMLVKNKAEVFLYLNVVTDFSSGDTDFLISIF